MKTLYIVAVLTPTLEQQASHCEPLKLMALLQTALASGGRDVVFYHVLVDGWDATDRIVAKWLSEQSAEAARKWRSLTTRGRLRLSAADRSLDVFLKTISCVRIVKAFPSSKYMNAYAIHGLLAAVRDGVRFKVATRCPLLIQRITIGPTLNDTEYMR